MLKFTAFCIGSDGQGTIWISSVEAEDAEAAKLAAAQDCADDWECPLEDVEVIGLAKGDIEIAYWHPGY